MATEPKVVVQQDWIARLTNMILLKIMMPVLISMLMYWGYSEFRHEEDSVKITEIQIEQSNLRKEIENSNTISGKINDTLTQMDKNLDSLLKGHK